MITLEEYVGPHADSPDWNEDCRASGAELVEVVNALMGLAEDDGVPFPINPATGTQISGRTYGGFRPQDCSQGAPDSSHKQGKAVDLYDPKGVIDQWLMDNVRLLETFDLYIEHPSATKGWAHITTRAPRSRNRVFYP